MQTELLTLLRQRSIVHPSQIVAVEVSHRTLRITLQGSPWWRSDDTKDVERLIFSFIGFGEGLLDPETLFDMKDDEALEIFSVTPLSVKTWAFGSASFQTYCTEPLPEPLNLYAIVEDYLWHAGAPRTARDYLQIPDGSLSRFCELTKSSVFLVAHAPQQLNQLIVGELWRQNVAHNVVTTVRRPEQGLFVMLGGARFVCESAIAEM